MSDGRGHRGRAPSDETLFAPERFGVLRRAVADLSLLFDRGYSPRAALKLVGDHHGLRERQRLAVLRCACSDAARAARTARRIQLGAARDRSLAVDGLNCLITIEAALGGALLLRGRDRVLRDLAGVHGGYRRVAETERAIEALGAVLARAAPASVRIYLDHPVSNSGRLRQLLRAVATSHGWPWDVLLVDNPDEEILACAGWLTASGDAAVLDRCEGWLHLTEAVIAATAPAAWIVDLGETPA